MTEETKEYPLSFSQERLWFLDQITPGSSLYNLQIDIPLQLELDEIAWRETIAEIIRRHESLRTVFHSQDGRPVQVVLRSLKLQIPTIDLTGLSGSECALAVERAAAEDSQRAFDLFTGPLLRGTLLRIREDAYVFLLTMHHIVTDGWSMDVITREIAILYEAFALGQPSPLPELPIQYPEFAVWQRERLSGDLFETQLSYWRKQLASLPALQLPSDRPRPAVPSYHGGYYTIEIPAAMLDAVRRLCHRQGATLFMTLIAAFQTLLMRYTGQEDIAIGTPIANRNHPDIELLIGFFVNTLVMRNDFSGAPTFIEVLRRVRENAIAAYSNQDLPFEKLVEDLQPQRDLSRNPLFQLMFVLQNGIAPTGGIVPSPMYQPGAAIPENTQYGMSKFDLTLYASESESGLTCIFEYSTDLYDDVTIRRFAGHWLVLLQSILANPEVPVTRLPILPAHERHKLLIEFNCTATAYPKELSITALFEQQVALHPNAIAINDSDREWSYADLNAGANRLARALLESGVATGEPVGISLPRSADQIIAVLAILKAGGAYLPLDPSYPPPRIHAMARDARVKVIVSRDDARTAADNLTTILDCKVIDVNERADDASNLDSVAIADSMAYVLYTSGSTGSPKGVCVTHRNVIRLVRNSGFCNFGPEEKVLYFAPLQFDASTFEIWGALLNGGCLEVVPAGLPSLADLGAFIERSGVTTLWLTASLFHSMTESQLSSLWGVRQLFSGGDVLSPASCQKVLDQLPDCILTNGYGPTETTTFATCHRMRHGDRIEGSVPIGRPIANTEIFLLDRDRQLVPVGVAGQLYIGGDGVAQGYLNDPQLTDQRFIPHPFAPNNSKRRVYATGDRARYMADGTLEFLGREDYQVKIRGFRVELGEIEATLRRHPLVRDACVMISGDKGEKQIIAYAALPVGASTAVAAEVRRYVQQQLPEYMVPSVIVPMAAFPMTDSGKLDRGALKPPTDMDWRPENSYAEPESGIEQTIAAVWREVLHVERVGRTDNFFDLGGHSLLLVQVHSRLQEVLGQTISMVDMFRCPTVEALAAHLVAEGKPGSRTNDKLFDQVEDRAAKQRLARMGRGSRPAFERKQHA